MAKILSKKDANLLSDKKKKILFVMFVKMNQSWVGINLLSIDVVQLNIEHECLNVVEFRIGENVLVKLLAYFVYFNQLLGATHT